MITSPRSVPDAPNFLSNRTFLLIRVKMKRSFSKVKSPLKTPMRNPQISMIHYQHTTENLSWENPPLSIRRLGTAQRLRTPRRLDPLLQPTTALARPRQNHPGPVAVITLSSLQWERRAASIWPEGKRLRRNFLPAQGASRAHIPIVDL
jgi:hypothetical protein